MSRGIKITITAIAVVAIAVIAYSVFPYASAAPIKNLKVGQPAYIYGTVQERLSIGNFSGFRLNDSSGSVFVEWNGTLPANGEKVLVHGTLEEISPNFLKLIYFKADSVIYWPI
ncbi:MAG: hypothetical protein QXV22_03905 [Thermoplasmataceae archaeon]